MLEMAAMVRKADERVEGDIVSKSVWTNLDDGAKRKQTEKWL